LFILHKTVFLRRRKEGIEESMSRLSRDNVVGLTVFLPHHARDKMRKKNKMEARKNCMGVKGIGKFCPSVQLLVVD